MDQRKNSQGCFAKEHRVFMGLAYERLNNLKFLPLLQGSFCWEGACQPHTVQHIMGLRG
jgi:hypothetical protein